MLLPVIFALTAGILVGVSRQINGRLSLSTSALVASFWNHLVGLIFLSVVGLLLGGLFTPGIENAPWHAFIGGTLGVIFVASGSWLIARIGAANTAILVIAGQMISGIALDWFTGADIAVAPSSIGVALIVAGALISRR